MKAYLLFFLSLSAFGSPVITLEPGTEITVTPNNTTIVRCEGLVMPDNLCRCAKGIYGLALQLLGTGKTGWGFREIRLYNDGRPGGLDRCKEDMITDPECQ